eukprot:TRINITY_DN3952_c0_g1_i1.p1 TRINITY_DN3952_c0_g1~~TRINITY_DN3952_c0_g1_i1.p1  ORF type:complete len:455 (-),score=59.77 TRINITY_DN3952_c0_g1_i1:91-1266(-)
MLGSPLWGALADTKEGRRKKIMIGLASVSLLCVSSLVPVALWAPKHMQFGLALTASCLSSFSGGSVGSLLDAIVVEQVPKNAYGRLRLWCAVGYGSSAGIIGLAMLYVGSDITWLPYVTHFAPGLLCGLVALSLMFFLEDGEKKGSSSSDVDDNFRLSVQGEDKDETKKGLLDEKSDSGFLDKISRVPRTLDMFLFIIVVFICGSCMGLVSTFLFLFIRNELQGDQLVMGVSVLFTCALEVPVFYFSENILNLMTADWSLVISLVAYIVRFGLYWLLAVFRWNAWLILVPELLHGFTFALMWCSVVAKATKAISGLGLTNFAVGFVTGVLTSGNVAGALVGGALLNHGVSYLWIWLGSTYMMGVVTVLWTLKVSWSFFGASHQEEEGDLFL